MNTTQKTKDENHGLEQAKAQLESIKEMVARLDDDQDAARESIEQDALSVEVRSDWYQPGDGDGAKPSEYTILLCTGGPAVRIIGDLNDWSEPESARIEHQDWFRPWTDYPLNSDEEKAVLAYANCFYFGE